MVHNKIHMIHLKSVFLFPAILLLISTCLSASDMIVGGPVSYTVAKGDSLSVVAAKSGRAWRIIAEENKIEADRILRVGEKISINTRRIVPMQVQDGIVINVPERMLYYFKQGDLVAFFPVGLGMSQKTKTENWQTPVGSFVVKGKEKNPTWHVPKSIQKEMASKGKPVEQRVPPGEDNPLGRYAIHTSIEGVLIHETIWPTSIHQFTSHGCIRMLPEHMEQFYAQISKGVTGKIIYEPVKVAMTSQGRVAIEVHRDFYKILPKSISERAEELIRNRGLSAKVDWQKVEKAVNGRAGIVVDVSP